MKLSRLLGHGRPPGPPKPPPPPYYGRITVTATHDGWALDEQGSTDMVVMPVVSLANLAAARAVTVTPRDSVYWVADPETVTHVVVGSADPRGVWRITDRWPDRVRLERVA